MEGVTNNAADGVIEVGDDARRDGGDAEEVESFVYDAKTDGMEEVVERKEVGSSGKELDDAIQFLLCRAIAGFLRADGGSENSVTC
jgi:hypothetical protein